MEYVVDLQGFRRSTNIFVLKEAAYAAIENGVVPSVLLFEPPCKWSRLLEEEKHVNGWLEQHYHGIPWKSGDIPYHHLIDVIQSTFKDAVKVYVKGLEKKKWLQGMLPTTDICDMDDICGYTLRQLNEGNSLPCNNHVLCEFPVCAAKNVDALRNWLLHQRKIEDDNYDDDDDDDDNEYLPLSQIH